MAYTRLFDFYGATFIQGWCLIKLGPAPLEINLKQSILHFICTCHRLPRGVGPRADMGTLTNLYIKGLVFPHMWGIIFHQSPQYYGGDKHPIKPKPGESRLRQHSLSHSVQPMKETTLIKYELKLQVNKSIYKRLFRIS